MNEMMKYLLQLFAEAEAETQAQTQAQTEAAPDGAAAPASETEAQPEIPEATEPPAPEAARTAQEEAPAPDPAQIAAALLELRAARARADARAVIAGWEREAAAMRAIYPAFDLKTAIREPGDFPRLLKAGLGVRRAYEAAHLEEILGAAMRYAARRAGQRTAEALESQRARPQENPVCSRAAVKTATDVNSLTRSDILRILGEVSRGARITFK